ncbi:MAG: hypothetical protein ABIH82_05820 [Candidatus Woesearchaeota archaeon]
MTKAKTKRSPPQKIRVTPHGEVNKTFLIAIIAVVALVGLAGLLFFTDTFVGKAITSGTNIVDLTYNRGEDVFTLTGDINGETVNEIFFTLTSLTEGYDVCDLTTDITITQGLEWDLDGVSAQEVLCESNVFTFGDAALWWEDFSTDSFELKFKLVTPPNNFELAVNNFNLVKSDGNYLFEDAQDTFSFSPPVVRRDTTPEAPQRTGGGGGSCTSQWNCTAWDTCNSSLQQSRTCVDTKCRRDDKTEVQSCEICQESWTCSLWTDCQNGIKSRTCVDEHHCGTSLAKPALTESCLTTAQSQAGQQYAAQGRQSTQQLAGLQQPSAKGTFSQVFVENKIYFIIIPLVLILIIIALVVLFRMRKGHKKERYNYDELKLWVVKEKGMGTSDEAIRKILKERTDWNDQDIDKIFCQIAGRCYHEGTVCLVKENPEFVGKK